MKKSKGFTIIELIVVIAVFLFIIGAAIGIFLSVVKNQKKVLAEQELLSQISYVEEYMSKAIRMAAVDTSGACLGTPGYIYMLTNWDSTISPAQFKGIKFYNQTDSICQEFYWDKTSGTLEEVRGGASPVALTPTSLQINSVKFSINGSNGGTFTCPNNTVNCGCVTNTLCGAWYKDIVQPRVNILLNIKIAGDSQEPNRTIQTMTSQRNLNTNYGQR